MNQAPTHGRTSPRIQSNPGRLLVALGISTFLATPYLTAWHQASEHSGCHGHEDHCACSEQSGRSERACHTEILLRSGQANLHQENGCALCQALRQLAGRLFRLPYFATAAEHPELATSAPPPYGWLRSARRTLISIRARAPPMPA